MPPIANPKELVSPKYHCNTERREELRVGRALWNHMKHEKGWEDTTERMREVRDKKIQVEAREKKLQEHLWQHRSKPNLRHTLLQQ